jgi:lipopolysaccharide/colanic/teichoic acid biosynthesis glycosyltransferase
MERTALVVPAAPSPEGALPELLRTLSIERDSSFARSRARKRALDIALAGTLLLLSVPLLALIALAVVLESPGPVFYRARRVGWRGRPLHMLKFRKMSPDTTGGARLTIDGDQRLTRVGALLSRTRLDELPQLWHVLRGEMSFVGPRPEDPDFVAARPDDYAEILTARPGLTGLSQLAFANERAILRSDEPERDYLERIFPQKCALDRLYISAASPCRDLAVLAWTGAAVLLRREVAVHRGTGRLGLRRRPDTSGKRAVIA